MPASLTSLVYLVAAVLFVLALRGLSHPETSRQGNQMGMAGMALGRHAHADAATAQAGLYDLPPFGNVSLLHMTDCHAQLKPIHFREPSVNLGLGSLRGQWPHRVGEHLLKAADLQTKLDAGQLPAALAAQAPRLIFNDHLNAGLTLLFLVIAWVVVVETARTCARVLRGAPTRPLAEAPYVATAMERP